MVRLRLTMKRHADDWQIAKEEVRLKFTIAGINTCEYQGYDCEGNGFLTFAHSLRRNDIKKYEKYDYETYQQKMREVARLCSTCHAEVDGNKRHVTYAIINWIINFKRKVKI